MLAYASRGRLRFVLSINTRVPVNFFMKQFSQFPQWLRVLLPTALISTCVAINAIAFTEIVRIVQSRRLLGAASALAELSPSTPEPSDTAINTAAKMPASQIEASALSDLNQPPSSESRSPNLLPQYGHFPYSTSHSTDMVMIASYAQGEEQRYEMLHPDAAAALLKMVSAARTDGVWLVPASGFRTLTQQRSLFAAQVATKGTPEAAALVSAPPGYSEHHTGYAVDLADGSVAQGYDISASFAQTPAFQWLSAHAATFGFELSFPENNEQGISYEPWHWRYIGTPAAKALFYPVEVP